MSYQVIARKYRPQRFADVVGQEHVTRTLVNAVRRSRIAHAYLFCGPRGTGKTTIARIFAKCLNCTGGPKVEFSDDDPRCREIAEGRSIDVLEIDGASNNGVDQVRELRETAKYAPASCKFKVYIIDEVHMLTTAAFNALLKTLEEPPAHVKFMFATTDPEKVLPTILSRCQRFDLRRIPAALIVKHLAHIAKEEGVKIDEAALFAIARGAEGAMRDAESTLDQLISFCGNEIVEADVLSMFGLAARGQVHSLTWSILAGDADKTMRELDELARGGKDLGRLLGDLLNHLRNLLIYQVSSGNTDLLEVSEADLAVLKEQSALLGTEALTRMMEVMAEGERVVRDAASARILLEVTLFKTMAARSAVSIEAVLDKLSQWRQSGAPAPIGPPSSRQTAPTAPTPILTTPPQAPCEAASAVQPAQPEPAITPAALAEAAFPAFWPKLLEALGPASAFAQGNLRIASSVSLADGVLTIGFDPSFSEALTLVDHPKYHLLIESKLGELGLSGTRVRFSVTEAKPAASPVPSTSGPPAASPPAVELPQSPARQTPAAEAPRAPEKPRTPKSAKLDPSDFKNDPLIKQALEIFKGEILEVRG